MSKITIIYDNYAYWEKDYIKELFIKLQCETIYVVQEVLQNKLDDEEKLINNNILVFSSNIYKYLEIKQIVHQLNPQIIIHLSDETGNNAHYCQLSTMTKLYLRQHYHHSYNCSLNHYLKLR